MVKARTEVPLNYKTAEPSTVKHGETGKETTFKLTGLYEDSTKDLYYRRLDNKINKEFMSQDTVLLYRDMKESIKNQPLKPLVWKNRQENTEELPTQHRTINARN